MPHDDEEFIRAIAKAVTALIIAHEMADPAGAIEALRNLLRVIAENGTVSSRQSAALARAVDRV